MSPGVECSSLNNLYFDIYAFTVHHGDLKALQSHLIYPIQAGDGIRVDHLLQPWPHSHP